MSEPEDTSMLARFPSAADARRHPPDPFTLLSQTYREAFHPPTRSGTVERHTGPVNGIWSFVLWALVFLGFVIVIFQQLRTDKQMSPIREAVLLTLP